MVPAGTRSWVRFAWTVFEKPGHHVEILLNRDHAGQTCLASIAFNLKQDYQILLKLPRPKGLVIHLSLEKPMLIKTERKLKMKKEYCRPARALNVI